jgi:hypothetical protein
MAFLGTDRCSRLGSGDAVLELLRDRDVVNTFVTSSVRIENQPKVSRQLAGQKGYDRA